MFKDREKVLEVKNLNISFGTHDGVVNAIRGVSFDLFKGETLAIVLFMPYLKDEEIRR